MTKQRVERKTKNTGGIRHDAGSSPYARGAPTNSASGSLVKMTFSTFLNSAGVLGESTWMVELSWALRRISFATSVGSLMGSSPHARGALHPRHVLAVAGGIIPACAGNTVRRDHSWRAGWDHPRMRGEHVR